VCAHQEQSLKRFLEKEKSMVTIKVKDGTPQGAETLCRPVAGHIVNGSRVEKEISAGISRTIARCDFP